MEVATLADRHLLGVVPEVARRTGAEGRCEPCAHYTSRAGEGEPRMRFLILAVALAFTASPALGQFRQELPQWAEQGNALDQNRFGLMYDLDWDVPQNDTEAGSWKPILIGAGIGLTVGFAIGWLGDTVENTNTSLECTFDPSAVGGCRPTEDGSPYEFRIALGLSGLAAGGVIGLFWALVEAAPD